MTKIADIPMTPTRETFLELTDEDYQEHLIDEAMHNMRMNIRTISERKRVTLKDIASEAGITYEALRQFLAGGDMKLRTSMRLCVAVGYKQDTLMRDLM